MKYVLTSAQRSLLKNELKKTCLLCGLNRSRGGYGLHRGAYHFTLSLELTWDQAREVTLGFTKLAVDNSFIWEREGLESWSEQGGPSLLEERVESIFPPEEISSFDGGLKVWILRDENAVIEFSEYLQSNSLHQICRLGNVLEDPKKLAHYVLRPPRNAMAQTSRLGVYVCRSLLGELDPAIQSPAEFAGIRDLRSTYDQDYLRTWLEPMNESQ